MSNIEVKYPVIRGMYKHYKGGKYVVLTMATDTETSEPVVVYKSLLFGSIYTRPLSVWNEDVTIEDGKRVPRFKSMNRDWQGELLVY